MMLLRTFVVIIAGIAAAISLGAPTFRGLGGQASGDFRSVANSVSANGSVVVGSFAPDNGFQAFRWTEATGFVSLGDLPGGDIYSAAAAVSHEGVFAVGSSISANGFEAFRWSQGTGMVGLGDLPGPGSFQSRATAVSADGLVVAGLSQRPQQGHGYNAWIWTPSGGMIPIGDLAGGDDHGIASDISADGHLVVGTSANSMGTEGFVWTQSAGMIGIGDLPGGSFSSTCTGVSALGDVVVGGSVSGNGNEAFRWTQAGGLEPLGDLPGGDFSSAAIAVSANGAVVVGNGTSSNSFEPFIWTRSLGMISLRDYLTAHGVTSHLSWINLDARDISADGRTIVGAGINANFETEGWIATIDLDESVAPTSFSLARGIVISGGLAELLQSDDQRLVLRPGPVFSSTEFPVQLLLNGQAPLGTLTSMRFRVEAHCNQTNITQQMSLFNFTSGTWQALDTRTSATSDAVVEVNAPSVSPFVESGTRNIRARVSYKANGPVLAYPWLARVDQTTWLFGR